MSATARPDRETLLLWVSAFFDGELSAGEEALLFEAMAEDPALEAAFLAMEQQGLALEHAQGSGAELAGLADAVMAEVAPEAVDKAGAPLLLSAFLDDEASGAQRERLRSLAADERTAQDALSFLHTSEGVSHALAGLPESPAVAAAVAPLPALVAARLENDERASALLSALADDALSATEEEELQALVTAGAGPELSFLHASEAVAYAVRAPASDPAAARAGAAALHAIEAEQLRQSDASASATRTVAAGTGAPSLVERLRAGFRGFFAPLAAAACAAAVFVSLQGAPGSMGPGPERSMPPEEWARTFLPLLEDEQADLLAAAQEPLELLADNGETEVQAIDSGTHMAAVFSTEASAITVIWVSEPLDGLAEPTESGT